MKISPSRMPIGCNFIPFADLIPGIVRDGRCHSFSCHSNSWSIYYPTDRLRGQNVTRNRPCSRSVVGENRYACGDTCCAGNSTRFSRSAQISCFSTLRLFRLNWISLLVRDPPVAYLLPLAHSAVIVPGATWTDTSGNVIQAHGGGFLKVGSTWYWHGEDKAHNSALFRAVSCYTSNNLVDWSRQNDALTPVSGTMISTSNIVERPKVIFNQKNNEYVMWFHSDSSNYGAAQVGVATAKSPCGPFTFRSSFKPLGAESRDMGLFQDDDSARTAYLLYASDNNQNFKISRLDADYYNIAAQVNTIPGSTLEAPGIIKRSGVYYLFASHTSGWDPNPNKFFTANSLSGTWSSQADIGPQAVRTYFSQNTFDLPLGQNGIYMGDRWRPSLLGSSRYIWLPLSWASGKPQLVQADVWSLDLNAGTYSVASGTSYEAENGAISGSASILSSSSFSGGRAVGWLGNGGSITINNVQGIGANQWVALYYANGDSGWRNTTVSVNGGAAVSIDQPNTGGGNVILSVPVKLNLRSGANSITFSAGQSNYAADLDKIIVYTQT